MNKVDLWNDYDQSKIKGGGRTCGDSVKVRYFPSATLPRPSSQKYAVSCVELQFLADCVNGE